LVKRKGVTAVNRAQDNKHVSAYMQDGDKLGYLWQQVLLAGADPA
jgi:hypothetical protein